MRALFTGLGSIGTRHLRNLHAVCREKALPLEAYALRSPAGGGEGAPRPLPQDVAALLAGQFTTLPEGQRWDVAFITGPTHLHAEALAQLKGRVGTFFIEKPIFHRADFDLDALGLGPAQKAYVAAPLRHTALYAAMEKALAGLPVYGARAICSTWLPGWRPGQDYRAGYAARKATGGGVSLDLIHEWDYLYQLLGPPKRVACMSGHYSNLEIDSDDLAVYIAQYRHLLCEVHLDYFGRVPQRGVTFFGREGNLAGDFLTGALTLPDGTTQDHAEDGNAKFMREMAYFTHYALNDSGESISSPARALQVLKIALGEWETHG